MVPIGILSRDRLGCLAATLYSMAATDLPVDTPITLFDDASQDPLMRAFLHGSEPVPVPRLKLPPLPRAAHGLSVVGKVPAVSVPRAATTLQLHCLGDSSVGVFRGSCLALLSLQARYPDAAGYILLQDDIVFKQDWYGALCDTAKTQVWRRPLGVLAGLRLNRKFQAHSVRGLSKTTRKVFPSYATGQCLFFDPQAVAAMTPWLQAESQGARRSKWDDTLCKYLDKTLNREVALLYPFCCQHTGVKSLVRPRRTWRQFGQSGRIGFYAFPPYAMGQELTFGPRP